MPDVRVVFKDRPEKKFENAIAVETNDGNRNEWLCVYKRPRPSDLNMVHGDQLARYPMSIIELWEVEV